MSYVLQGVLGSARVLAPARRFKRGRIVPLDQDIFLLPIGRDLFDEVRAGESVEPAFAPSRLFPPAFDQVLAGWSTTGPLAYVEADYFGGVGTQFAVVWRAGAIVFGPAVQPERAPGSLISQALRLLGASSGGHVDEFDAVGLGRYRDVDDWLRSG